MRALHRAELQPRSTGTGAFVRARKYVTNGPELDATISSSTCARNNGPVRKATLRASTFAREDGTRSAPPRLKAALGGEWCNSARVLAAYCFPLKLLAGSCGTSPWPLAYGECDAARRRRLALERGFTASRACALHWTCALPIILDSVLLERTRVARLRRARAHRASSLPSFLRRCCLPYLPALRHPR